MIELHIGIHHSDHEPRWFFPENGMSPYQQIEWARLLIEGYGSKGHILVCTYSPFIIGVLNNGLTAYKLGEKITTPPLDPAHLQVWIHKDPHAEPEDGFDKEVGLIDDFWIGEAGDQVMFEFSELQEKLMEQGK